MAGYWNNVLSQRVRRRQAMVMTGSAALGAAFLAACGGSDSGGGAKSNGGSGNDAKGNSLVTTAQDTTKTAVRGGSFKDRATGDPNTLDISGAINPLNISARLAYNTLVRVNVGVGKQSDNTIGPDLAESFETSPDGLQITMKLRQGVKFHNLPPVNGRTMDADDILYTWDRFSKKSSNRSGLVNAVNPQAPVLSLTASDSKTIVIKLKEPLVYALDLFASNTASHSGSVLIIPKETDNGFNIGTDMIGAGPYYMAKYEPSVGFTMKRHADYYDKDWGLVDEIDLPIIVQYPTVISQIQAGNLLTFSTYTYGNQAIRGEDVRVLGKVAELVGGDVVGGHVADAVGVAGGREQLLGLGDVVGEVLGVGAKVLVFGVEPPAVPGRCQGRAVACLDRQALGGELRDVLEGIDPEVAVPGHGDGLTHALIHEG
jgi:ABC-type transport system substrate-binding protein